MELDLSGRSGREIGRAARQQAFDARYVRSVSEPVWKLSGEGEGEGPPLPANVALASL
jgi:hypothetical protein